MGDLIGVRFYCPRCGTGIPHPDLVRNPKGIGWKSKCPKCKAEVISDELGNFITKDWRGASIVRHGGGSG